MLNYAQKFKGIVSEVTDPEQRGRVKVQIPDLFYDSETNTVLDSPWCEAHGATGPDSGLLNVPPIGSPVWLEGRYSESGDIFQFVYSPGPIGQDKSGKAHGPATGRGEDDETAQLKVPVPFKVPDPNLPSSRSGGKLSMDGPEIGDFEIPGIPPTAQAAEYPQNRVLKTPGGITIEWDDSAGGRRVHVWHPSGAYIEINDKGVYTQRSTKKWEAIEDSRTTQVITDDRINIGRHELKEVGRHSIERMGGRKVIEAREIDITSRVHTLMKVGGTFRQKIRGEYSQRIYNAASQVVGGVHKMSSAGRFTQVCVSGADLFYMPSLNPLARNVNVLGADSYTVAGAASVAVAGLTTLNIAGGGINTLAGGFETVISGVFGLTLTGGIISVKTTPTAPLPVLNANTLGLINQMALAIEGLAIAAGAVANPIFATPMATLTASLGLTGAVVFPVPIGPAYSAFFVAS